jgi:DNA-binding HxlR family transcriptional regulator
MSVEVEIARGAWTRLRNLIGALDRVDRLETSTEFDGWLQSLAQDDELLDGTLREFLLRALRLTGDPLNFQILLCLRDGARTASKLLDATQLSRVELIERLNELARAGLTIQTLETECIEVTPFASNLLALVDGICAQTRLLARDDFLLNPKAPAPKPKLQLPTTKFSSH